jgi:hypothetical protein
MTIARLMKIDSQLKIACAYWESNPVGSCYVNSSFVRYAE